MKKTVTFLCMGIFALLLSSNVFAQRDCGTMNLLEQQLQEQPALLQQMDQIERFTEDFVRNNSGEARGTVYTIPVVVHVVYKTNAQNVSDAQIASQLQVLNDDFRRMNADADNVWSQAADVEIEFCLATQAPDGSATSGIQRRKTNKPSFSYGNDGVKFNNKGGLNAWPADDYMNLWVCNLGNSLLGYAQFPGGADATDGVVIDYAYFGSGGSAQAPYDLGRTATHEVGHWLNLRHIWGDGGCNVDDFVSDTPLSDASNGGCAIGHVSCGSVDMVQNYMDYSYDDCMNLFTLGQGDRMRALFAPGGARASLLTSNGCSGGSTPTCSDGIQNGNETGVDCGGDCDPCSGGPTCSDGIQNGNETGVDCGGPDCAPCNTGSCDTPAGLFASNIKPKRAKLNWSAASGANSYNVQIRDVGGNWQTTSTTNTNRSFNGLSNGTTYEWRVQSVCSGSTSAYSTTCTFTAGQSNSGACGGNRIAITKRTIDLYPNPARENLTLSTNIAIEQAATVYIQDMHGRILSASQQSNLQQLTIPVNDLNAGIYILRIDLGDGDQEVMKFMIID